MCSTDVLLFKQTGGSTKETITIISCFGIGQKKTVDAAKFGGAENVAKNRNPANIRKWIARFYYWHYCSAGSACVLTIIAWVAHHCGAALCHHCSLIYFWVRFSCFCSESASPLRWNNPVQRCLPVGGGCIIRAGERGGFTDWQAGDLATDDDQRQHHHGKASFSAASANSFVYFASSAATSRWRICMSVIAAFASFSSLAFCRAGLGGNGVITVMINSPWQADDDADNQSGDNRGDSAHTSISLNTFRPLRFEFCNQAVSLMLELTITSAPWVKPDIAATVDCLTDITHDQCW